MSDVVIAMTLPLDRDGFLRRECPACERQFKWLQSEADGEPQGAMPLSTYFCPYCYEPAGADDWWTKEQLEYARARTLTDVIGPELEKFKRGLRSLNRPNRGFRVDISHSTFPTPQALNEQDDMKRIDPPCHPSEPIKVSEAWDSDIGCLICGTRYPLDLATEDC